MPTARRSAGSPSPLWTTSATTADRILGAFDADIAARPDVVWMDRPPVTRRRPPTLRVAPLEVGGLLASGSSGRRTVVLTSATLALGGSFEPLARQWGLPPPGAGTARESPPAAITGTASARDGAPQGDWQRPGDGAVEDVRPTTSIGRLAWSGHGCRLAVRPSAQRHPLRREASAAAGPGRASAESYLTELAELIEAAGGRTLGLFSSMRAARQAADELREGSPSAAVPGRRRHRPSWSASSPTDEATCLFGTLSLWQGVDVPGPSLQLVVIDRIPFPRPDDPLASARQRAVAAHGGNGFMTVAAAHAALLLAQGAGRLLRTMDDRGVVAILDPRLATARYAGFLRASLPPFWATTDPAVARGALRRLAASHG